MNDAEIYWFSPAPDAFSSTRLSLDFGLRGADLYFRDLVVPGIGRIWFARQLSWPLAALALQEGMARQGANAPRPSAICHGIEALACKLAYREDPDARSQRVLGRRAFGRDPDFEIRSFTRLRQAVNYVRNTHRQAATRAIVLKGGLGLARGPRFDLLKLEPVGRALADAFLSQRVGRGGMGLSDWLREWFDNKRDIPGQPETLRLAVSPHHPSPVERELVRARLLGTTTPASEKRRRLADALGTADELPDIESEVVPALREAGHRDQANEVVAARAFGAMLDRARDTVGALTRAVQPARNGVPVTTLADDSTLRSSLRRLRSSAENYTDKANVAGITERSSHIFADAVRAAADAEAIRLLVQRADEVFALADGAVVRGGKFRPIGGIDDAADLEDGTAAIEPDRTGRTFRIANLHALLRDVDAQEAE
jgi:hypothetical protein